MFYCQIDYQCNYRFVYPCHWRSSKHRDNPRGCNIAYSRKGLIFPFYPANVVGTTLRTYREKVSITSNPPHTNTLFYFSILTCQRMVYLISMGLYTVFTIICGIASNLGLFFVFRILQGVAASSGKDSFCVINPYH